MPWAPTSRRGRRIAAWTSSSPPVDCSLPPPPAGEGRVGAVKCASPGVILCREMRLLGLGCLFAALGCAAIPDVTYVSPDSGGDTEPAEAEGETSTDAPSADAPADAALDAPVDAANSCPGT